MSIKTTITDLTLNTADRIVRWSAGGSLHDFLSRDEYAGAKPINHKLPANYDNYIKHGFKKNPWVFRCVTLIADAVATLPYQVIQKDSEGNVDVVNDENNPLVGILKRPNPQFSWEFFVKLLVFSILGGEGYVLPSGMPDLDDGGNIPDSSQGNARSLYLLKPSSVTPVASDFFWGIAKGYDYNPPQGATRRYLPSELLQIKMVPNPADPLYGLSPLEAAWLSTQLSNTSNTWLNSALNNGLGSGMFMVNRSGSPLSDKTQKAAKELIKRLNSGPLNAGKVFLSDQLGPEAVPGYKPVDLELLGVDVQQIRNICSALGVPPPLAGLLDDAKYANIEKATENFYRDRVLPIGSTIVEEINVFFEMRGVDGFNNARLDEISALSEDRDSVAKRNTSYAGVGGMSPNEVARRAGVDENQLDPAGELQYVPANWIPINEAGSPVDREPE